MSELQTPDFTAEGSVSVGAFRWSTEHAVAGIAMGALALVWAIRFTFPKP